MSENKTIKIIIADDHPIFRNGLRKLIEEDSLIEIIGEAENGEAAMELITGLKPMIAVLDIDMPKMSGIQVLKTLNKLKIEIKIIFLTVFASEDIFDKAMSLGISGYILKDSAVNEIKECIRKVAEGNYYISPSVSNFLVNRKDRLKKLENDNPELKELTKTELNVLKLIAEGKTSKDIGDELFISFKTVENHRTNISHKLKIAGSNSLIKYAIKNRSLL
ncbi:MAG: response regulator transcription factor [Ignavibacteria bacterium]|nr:response regulator transcription factor [Ignavibacteria bacterium]